MTMNRSNRILAAWAFFALAAPLHAQVDDVQYPGLLALMGHLKHQAVIEIGAVVHDATPIPIPPDLQDKPKDMPLDEWRYRTERAMATVRVARRRKVQAAVRAYQDLADRCDQVILQLCADMRRRNSRKPYKRLDNILKESITLDAMQQHANPDVRALYRACMALDDLRQACLHYGYDVEVESQEIAWTDVIPSLGDINDVVAGLSERRATKVSNLVELLQEARLPEVDLAGGKAE